MFTSVQLDHRPHFEGWWLLASEFFSSLLGAFAFEQQYRHRPRSEPPFKPVKRACPRALSHFPHAPHSPPRHLQHRCPDRGTRGKRVARRSCRGSRHKIPACKRRRLYHAFDIGCHRTPTLNLPASQCHSESIKLWRPVFFDFDIAVTLLPARDRLRCVCRPLCPVFFGLFLSRFSGVTCLTFSAAFGS